MAYAKGLSTGKRCFSKSAVACLRIKIEAEGERISLNLSFSLFLSVYLSVCLPLCLDTCLYYLMLSRRRNTLSTHLHIHTYSIHTQAHTHTYTHKHHYYMVKAVVYTCTCRPILSDNMLLSSLTVSAA